MVAAVSESAMSRVLRVIKMERRGEVMVISRKQTLTTLKTKLRMKSWFSRENSTHAHMLYFPRTSQVWDFKGDVEERPPFAQSSKILTIECSLPEICGAIAPIAARKSADCSDLRINRLQRNHVCISVSS